MTTTEPLLRPVRRIARTARSAYLWREVGRSLALVLVAWGLLAAFDYWQQTYSVPGRIVLSLLTLAAGLAGISLAWRAWRRPAFPLPIVASRMEEAAPELRGYLRNGVEFAAGAAVDGSQALRQATIAEARRRLDAASLPPLVDWTQAYRTGLVVAVLLVGFAIVYGLAPETSRQLVARLTQPRRSLPYPRRHELRFVELPTAVPQGAVPRISAEVAGRDLPEVVHADTIFQSEKGRLRDRRDLLVHQGRVSLLLPPLEKDVWIRLHTDDQRGIPWQRIRVVPAPRLVVTRPDAMPPKVELHVKGMASMTPDGGVELALQLSDDRGLASAQLMVDESTMNWWQCPTGETVRDLALSRYWPARQLAKTEMSRKVAERNVILRAVVQDDQGEITRSAPASVELTDVTEWMRRVENALGRLMIRVEQIERHQRSILTELADRTLTGYPANRSGIDPNPLASMAREQSELLADLVGSETSLAGEFQSLAQAVERNAPGTSFRSGFLGFATELVRQYADAEYPDFAGVLTAFDRTAETNTSVLPDLLARWQRHANALCYLLSGLQEAERRVDRVVRWAEAWPVIMADQEKIVEELKQTGWDPATDFTADPRGGDIADRQDAVRRTWGAWRTQGEWLLSEQRGSSSDRDGAVGSDVVESVIAESGIEVAMWQAAIACKRDRFVAAWEYASRALEALQAVDEGLRPAADGDQARWEERAVALALRAELGSRNATAGREKSSSRDEQTSQRPSGDKGAQSEGSSTMGDSPATAATPDRPPTSPPVASKSDPWGQLPPRERAALEQGRSQPISPEHRDLIEDYFERIERDRVE